MAKHAGEDASARLTLRQEDHQLRFEVRDAGIGFDPCQDQRGNGLLNMRDRIEAIGGTLTITTCRGRGTTVRGAVPVP